MLDKNIVRDLKIFSIDIRKQTMRQFKKLGFGHLGGAMSMVDILSTLYGLDMKINPSKPDWDQRDLLVCSKGHAGPSIYATLALKGYFPMDWLDTLNQPGTRLPSHCDRNKTPGIDMTTGSLGQGVSVAAGMALALKTEESDRSVFCIIGDGETQEGQVWEAALFSAQKELSNLIVFLDFNKMQLDGSIKEINDLGDIGEKFKNFGWYVQEIDGHDHLEIHMAISNAKNRRYLNQPCMIVANTVKGKGCAFAVNKMNHHITISENEAASTIEALERERAEIVR